MDKEVNSQESEVAYRQMAADEISLIDLCLIIWKRKTMIVVVTLMLTVSAAVLSFLMPQVYEVTAILEPAKDNDGVLVESPQTIRENILGGSYDQLVAVKANLSFEAIPEYRVNVPKETDLVKISIESSEPQQAVSILTELLNVLSEEIGIRLEKKIQKIKNEIRATELEDSLLIEQISLLKKQTSEIQLKVKDLESGRKAAIDSPKKDAMAVLLYSNEIQNQQIYLNDLQEKLTILENSKKKLSLKIDNLKLDVAGIKGTRINKKPTLPDLPIKPKKILIVTLAFMIGLVGSILLSFFFEILNNVRQQLATEEN